MMLWLLQHIPSTMIYLLITCGLVIYLTPNLMAYTNMSPTFLQFVPTRTLGLILILVGVFLQGLTWGADTLSAEVQKANAEAQKIKEESKNISERVVTKYIVKQKVIKEKGDEIIKYVNKNNDADCTLHNSFVELHNSAAKNTIPDPTRATDEAASGIELSEAKRVIIENYNQYNQVAEQLRDLQDWIKQQREINK